MSDIAIRVENISKLYQLGEISTGTISRDLHRWWAKIRGQEDPFLKIGQVNNRTDKTAGDFVWALKDISFDVHQGEVLGIIGKNGAGKSTLLKILSRVTKPTTGRIRVKGRIASLLEVGTGFHPELTGRENIFLNGAIMGMTKLEIKSKLDEIIDFAGVEKYIDTPVKRYSSGMYVRLAFAVAAHLDPEILIVDEVLAVGDAEFQKKCLGKMKDVSQKDGRTVLFVSHNLEAVQKLCTRGVLLENGEFSHYGQMKSVLDKYLSISKAKTYHFTFNQQKENPIGAIRNLTIENPNGPLITDIQIGVGIQFLISFELFQTVNEFIIGIGICSSGGIAIQTTWSLPTRLTNGKYEVIFNNNAIFYAPGNYFLNIGISSKDKNIEFIEHGAQFTVSSIVPNNGLDPRIVNTQSGLILNQFESKFNKL